MVVYSGYRFPSGVDEKKEGEELSSGRGEGGGMREDGEGEKMDEALGPQLLRYDLSTSLWEELQVAGYLSGSPYPQPRYRHTAVVYNVRERLF